MKAYYKKHTLIFKRPSGTSRGVLLDKETWFLFIEKDGKQGVGECGILRGLSIDDRSDYEEKLKWVCDNVHLGEEKLWENLVEFPSIQFGIEMAFLSLESENPFLLFLSSFTEGTVSIPINGLIWMGDDEYMRLQIDEKIAQGFRCIKMKIGALDFEKELELLQYIRSEYHEKLIEIRVDANGAFDKNNALDKITQLFGLKLHSIEQPIKKNNTDTMSVLCKNTPIPIALDEELIGVFSVREKEDLLDKVMPQYLILKPSFIGGFRGTSEWISLAEKRNIGWWITSALESNVGLNAIAQFTFQLQNPMPQGLGTGGLFTNNFDSPLKVLEGSLWYDNSVEWKFEI